MSLCTWVGSESREQRAERGRKRDASRGRDHAEVSPVSSPSLHIPCHTAGARPLSLPRSLTHFFASTPGRVQNNLDHGHIRFCDLMDLLFFPLDLSPSFRSSPSNRTRIKIHKMAPSPPPYLDDTKDYLPINSDNTNGRRGGGGRKAKKTIKVVLLSVLATLSAVQIAESFSSSSSSGSFILSFHCRP